jgi:glycosyltransferase involved in cell wall biosynthesis
MRICVLLQDLYGGGAERAMLQLAAGIAERSCDVDLLLVRREGAYLDAISPKLRVRELGTGRMLKSIAALAAYLRRERPAALISALPHVNVGAILAAELARTATRVIVTEHSMISRTAAAETARTVRLAHRTVPWLYPRATGIVTVSEGVADDLARFCGIARDRIDVIYNGIITDDLYRRAAEPCHHPWLAPGQPPVVLAAGRLVPVKNYPLLVRAFARLRAARPARLLVLGDGGERGRLKALAEELGVGADVGLEGFVANPFPFMKRAAAFVQSSHWEGLPTVLIEALACGTRVVATDCPGGTREILDNGTLGDLVPVDDPGALAAALSRAIDRKGPAVAFGHKARQFTLDRAVDAYLRLALGPLSPKLGETLQVETGKRHEEAASHHN